MTDLGPNLAPLTLIAAGCLMLIAEIFVPSFGLLGVAGLVVFTYGASQIFDGDTMMAIWAFDAAALLIMLAFGIFIARTRRQRITTGIEGMAGKEAEIVDWVERKGTVRIQGELWAAEASGASAYKPGDTVIVSGFEDLVLKIRKD